MRVPRWTTSLVCAGLTGAVLSGCRSSEHAFRATRVPVVRFDSVLKTADSVRLPLADARLLLAVAADSTFALRAPHDTMTMTDILAWAHAEQARKAQVDRKSTRLNSSHSQISYAVFCLKKKKL